MNINELTIGQAKELASMFGGNSQQSHPYAVGENYFIRTVTYYYVGKLIAVFAQELVLEHASWVADTGRFHAALRDGVFDEIEPYPLAHPVIIGRGSVIDATIFDGDLPGEAK